MAGEAQTTPPRCGDHVLHHPTGETWMVAYADRSRDELAPAGWPNTLARLSDCEVVRCCTDAEHVLAVSRWRGSQGGDSRRELVLTMYGG